MKYGQSSYETVQRAYQSQLAEASDKTLDFNRLVIQPIEDLLAQVVAFIPDLLVALYTLVFGWIIAKLLQIFFRKFFMAVGFDNIARKMGITDAISTENSKPSPSAWFANLAFWITIFFSIAAALDHLRLRIASFWLDQVMLLVTTILSAVIILTLGMFLSIIIARIVRTSAQSLKVPKPDFYAGVVKWGILLFTLILTLTQFHIPPDYVLGAIAVVFGTLCITFVVAFGFGGRQWAGKVLDRLY